MTRLILPHIEACNCIDGGNQSTYTEVGLDGKIFSVFCCECDDYVDFNNCETDDVIKDWNNHIRKSQELVEEIYEELRELSER